ncbi:MAG: hypothetical protein ACYS9Y_02470 [Planctomycetota bacterium]|jgi:hypothetical protein
MAKKKFILGLACAIAGLAVWSLAVAGEKKKLLRVGVYDSRAIPMAYTHSQYGDDFMPKLSREKKEAEARGDVKKAQELEEKMQRYALKRHKQVFSTAPVHDLLDLVQERIPEVAKQTGVDLIASKWEIVYLASDVEVVDVTLKMAKMFEPKLGTLEAIQELMKKEPLTEEEVERLEKEHPH